jgi:hypothetical protein
MSSFRRHLVVPIACALAAGACATPEATSRRMLDLNREALTAYQGGELPRARDLLLQAVTLGKEAGLGTQNSMARTYLDLAAVYLAMKERDKGMRHLGLALRIEPDIEPTEQIAGGPVKKALNGARAELRRRRGQANKDADKGNNEKAEKAAEKAAPPSRPEPAPHAVVKATPPKPEPKAIDSKPALAKADTKSVETKAPESKPTDRKPAPAVAQAPAPSVDEEEPDLPAAVPQPLYCPTPEVAPPSAEIALRCVPRPGVAVGKMMLFYRSAGKEEFTSVPMTRSHKGWYSGLVPASAVVGRSLQYYVEARAPNRKATSNGQPDSPNTMSIREGAAPVGRGTLAAAHFKSTTVAKDDNPLLAAEAEREHAVVESSDHRRLPRRPFVGAGIGSGWGWHTRRVLEFKSGNAVEPGFSPGTLLQLTPELGYQLDARYAFSLQLRYQYIPETGSGDTSGGHPQHSAWALLARGYRYYGDRNAQLFTSATFGGGQGFRLVIPPSPPARDGTQMASINRNDTIRGGPIVLGPGAGVVYHFTSHFAFLAEARLLVGVPDFATIVEVSTGAQVGF